MVGAELVDRLRRAGCVAAEEEAARLAEAAPDDPTLQRWVARREQGEPLPWITGRFEFCERSYRIDPGVYVPRPQTEELARRAATALPDGGRALDLCTGSGVVAAHLAAAVPTAVVIAIDIDPRAAGCARRNGALAVVGDLASCLAPRPRFDVITAVAPYVPTAAIRLLPADVQRWEPRRALDGGEEGTQVIEAVIEAAGRLLRPGGRLVLELGGVQDVAVAAALRQSGLGPAEPWFDADGDVRGLSAPRPI